MTKDNFKYLQSFAQRFECASKYNYLHAIPSSDLDKLMKIYEIEKGKKYVLCKHCSTSVLAFVKVMAKIYNEELRKIETTKAQSKKDKDNEKNEQRGKRK